MPEIGKIKGRPGAGIPKKDRSNRSRMQEAYCMPLTAPAYPSPPYLMHKRSEAIMVFFRADPEALAAEVPEPLEPSGDNLCHAWIADLSQPPHTLKHYHEGLIGIKVRFKDIVGWYVPYTWTHNDEVVLLGREIYGWPEQICDNDKLVYEGNQVFAVLRRRGETLMRVSFRLDSPPGTREARRLEKELDTIMGPHSLQIRKFPSPERNGKPLKQLIHIAFENVKIHEIWSGTAALEFGSSGAYPLIHRLAPKEIVRAYWLKPEWILPYGKVIWEQK